MPFKKYYSCEAGRSIGKHLQNPHFRGFIENYWRGAALTRLRIWRNHWKVFDHLYEASLSLTQRRSNKKRFIFKRVDFFAFTWGHDRFTDSRHAMEKSVVGTLPYALQVPFPLPGTTCSLSSHSVLGQICTSGNLEKIRQFSKKGVLVTSLGYYSWVLIILLWKKYFFFL